jgi:branched-chain amino acid transport system permease protein
VADTFVLQVVVEGLALGTIYSTLALALVLIYRTTGIINFAQGEMGMFCTYVVWSLYGALGSIYAALAIGLVFAFGLGMAVERAVIRGIARFGEFPTAITTLGLFLIFNEMAPWIWGTENHAFPSLFGRGAVVFGGVTVAADSLGTLATMTVVAAGFFAMLRYTRLGLAMRAAAANPDSSRLVGIPVRRLFTIGWGMATVLACLAGALIAPRLLLDSNLMLSVIVYAFAAAALGGFHSLFGAVVGGLIIGVVENLAANFVDFIGADLKITVPLALILLVLLFRPNGLFGHADERRV